MVNFHKNFLMRPENGGRGTQVVVYAGFTVLKLVQTSNTITSKIQQSSENACIERVKLAVVPSGC